MAGRSPAGPHSRMLLCSVLVGVLVSGLHVQGVPAPDPRSFPEEAGLFEGDIMLGQGQERNLLARSPNLWPHGVLPYDFSHEFDAHQKKMIDKALAQLQPLTCVRFKHRTHERTYLHLRNSGRGCAAPVGYRRTGTAIDLYLKYPGCQRYGTIQHEFLHALGFWHEHTRPDRDKYIDILWGNIMPGLSGNFLAHPASEVESLQMPYDYDSVMHYRSRAFSKDGHSYTIIPKDKTALNRIGQRVRFSRTDLAKLNRLYKCPPPYYRGDDLLTK